MAVVNLVIVLNPQKTKVLMCQRKKNPYQGLYNFVGGKVEANENHLEAAYRELGEETGIAKTMIDLDLLFATRYFPSELELQVYVGVLEKEMELVQEINPLIWFDIDTDFLDQKFAGDGNVQHMIACVQERFM